MEIIRIIYFIFFIYAFPSGVVNFIIGYNHPFGRFWWWRKLSRNNILISHDIFCYTICFLVPLLYFIFK